MYLTVEEAAEFLEIPASQVKNLIHHKQIRAIHDGEQFLINKEQFNTHLEQLEKYKRLVEDLMNEPLPEDIDVKDED
ncbi:excisionase family DNA-binding protein [Priestia filamentosa]|uniref:excisionase family DNA-binding protein n=1 Tax=Priestia filamentosa TaxID=1402861 RepID=UPI001FB40958|nr:excisionase family DNA-binding protein [Priestia filamentosa]MED3727891.1 excisionase family DNA-binding protein [Priestia filamentosa]UOE60235.1 excisionase family DNA-binding protein [Priestia filamentosa]